MLLTVRQIIYNISLYVSGSISISGAPAERLLTVNWLLGGPTGTIVETDTHIPGTALIFTKTDFDTIELVVAAGTDVTPNITAEICVTARYPVSAKSAISKYTSERMAKLVCVLIAQETKDALKGVFFYMLRIETAKTVDSTWFYNAWFCYIT